MSSASNALTLSSLSTRELFQRRNTLSTISLRSERNVVRRSRFSEEQIIAVLKESDAGVETGELRRRHGITRACFYRWKSKYGGMEVSEAMRLRALEEETGS